MNNLLSFGWLGWALLSAIFAALTAIFAKVGVEGIDSNIATFIRTIIISGILGLGLGIAGKLSNMPAIG